MPKQAGRLCVLKKGATAIAGARVVGLSWNGQPIDVTDQGDSGIQSFLAGHLATDTMEVTIEGLEEDGVIRTAALSGGAAAKFLSDLTFEFPTGDTITGNFVLTTYTESGPHDDAQTFNATFVRNGVHTFTPDD